MDVCRDGAPEMLGSRSGLTTMIKQRSPNAVGTHFVIHREVLASRTSQLQQMTSWQLPFALSTLSKQVLSNRATLPLCARIWMMIMRLSLFHSAVRWLAKGTILARVYELRKEVEVFLEAQGNQNLLHLFIADGFQLTFSKR